MFPKNCCINWACRVPVADVALLAAGVVHEHLAEAAVGEGDHATVEGAVFHGQGAGGHVISVGLPESFSHLFDQRVLSLRHSRRVVCGSCN